MGVERTWLNTPLRRHVIFTGPKAQKPPHPLSQREVIQPCSTKMGPVEPSENTPPSHIRNGVLLDRATSEVFSFPPLEYLIRYTGQDTRTPGIKYSGRVIGSYHHQKAPKVCSPPLRRMNSFDARFDLQLWRRHLQFCTDSATLGKIDAANAHTQSANPRLSFVGIVTLS